MKLNKEIIIEDKLENLNINTNNNTNTNTKTEITKDIELEKVNKIININYHKYFDYVITNPPFGIQSIRSADVLFLEKAILLSNDKVFSMHKSNTFDYLKKFYNLKGYNKIIKHEIEFDIPKTYKFHKEKNKVIKVCCIEADLNSNN